jgi:DNA-binding CsgD family transcriptional regulator
MFAQTLRCSLPRLIQLTEASPVDGPPETGETEAVQGVVMAHAHTVRSLVRQAQDVSVDPGTWPVFLANLASAFGADAAYVSTCTDGAFDFLHESTYNISKDVLATWRADYLLHDPVFAGLVKDLRPGLFYEYRFASEAELRTNPYLAWQERVLGTRYRIGATLRPASHLTTGISIHRSARLGHVDAHEIAQFDAIARELQTAVSTSYRIGAMASASSANVALMDMSPWGVILLDSARRVVFANTAAQAIGNEADGLRLSMQGLSLIRRLDDQKLQAAISAALAGPLEGGPSDQLIVALRPSGLRPYVVRVAGLGRRGQEIFGGLARCAITIVDPEFSAPHAGPVIARVFGLTAMEADVAMALMRGLTVAEAASALKVQPPTVRTHLANLFRKTETRRQAELVQLLSTVMLVQGFRTPA